jgi:hypothetical protein
MQAAAEIHYGYDLPAKINHPKVMGWHPGHMGDWADTDDFTDSRYGQTVALFAQLEI